MSLGARLAHSARFLKIFQLIKFFKSFEVFGRPRTARGLGALKGRRLIWAKFWRPFQGAPPGGAGVAGALVTPLGWGIESVDHDPTKQYKQLQKVTIVHLVMLQD